MLGSQPREIVCKKAQLGVMGFPWGVGGAIICRYGSYGVSHMVLSNSCSKI